MANNYDGKFVKVDNTWLPSPSTYRMTTIDLVDSARTSDGKMSGNPIRQGIRKIEMSWRFLTQAQYTLIASLFVSNFVNSVYYYDTITGTYQTRTMYVGDRVSDMAELVVELKNDKTINSIQGYANVKLSLIEV